MKLEYIKANGIYWRPQEAGVQDPKMIEGACFPVCYIKKRWFGIWQIDYYDNFIYAYKSQSDNQKPVSKLLLYPNGIEEIRFSKDYLENES